MARMTATTANFLMSYEEGELEHREVIDGFAELIKSGLCWELQGHYGRTAMSLVHGGFVTAEGEVLYYGDDE